ncbi:hypothetical protein SAMN05216276_100570 [Streptosporangium subroseum]|uniref:Uncharacterized protein n=1 Tax=Streptosporangium subroseum TaxID=106412 RepID=A0A239C968_9ACTN|nr:hypothetical protein [Streptosporangium subroseum]SNS16650.1 hypothetical protein SAMN05216276_100570 [Streptosporangium subroseum]
MPVVAATNRAVHIHGDADAPLIGAADTGAVPRSRSGCLTSQNAFFHHMGL